jgi:hypothetical protein
MHLCLIQSMSLPARAHLIIAVLLSMGIATAARGQTVSPEQAARAVSTVMNYRRGWMDDPLVFDVCSVRQALGGAEDFASMIAPQVRAMLNDTETSCPRSPVLDPRMVLVDSVRQAEPAVLVYVTVLRGELIHREIHELNSHVWTPMMGVRSVRLWGSGQFYPVRPGRSGAQPER